MSVHTFLVTLALNKKRLWIMSEEQMNSYRLTSMEEPGDERMAQIMREVAEDARESTRRAAERVAAGIEAASQAAQEKWGDAINRIKNGSY
ncbi:hypothetical protein HDR58_08380 [bacterium]|nr:hypothetical protein [bacterium]